MGPQENLKQFIAKTLLDGDLLSIKLVSYNEFPYWDVFLQRLSIYKA